VGKAFTEWGGSGKGINNEIDPIPLGVFPAQGTKMTEEDGENSSQKSE